jgi:hypothetical protein
MKVTDAVEDEHQDRGFHGRFGAGLPRINDGALLFLQHVISKMRINLDVVREVRIPVPPIAEQVEFVEKVRNH